MSSENVNQTYLITGVNRGPSFVKTAPHHLPPFPFKTRSDPPGIGHAFLRSFLPRPDTTVIATVRAPTDPTVAAAMASVPVGSGSRLIVMELASTAEHGARDMVAELRRRYGVLRVDVVVANAGIGRGYGAVREVDVKEVWEHVGVNGIGECCLARKIWVRDLKRYLRAPFSQLALCAPPRLRSSSADYVPYLPRSLPPLPSRPPAPGGGAAAEVRACRVHVRQHWRHGEVPVPAVRVRRIQSDGALSGQEDPLRT